MDELDAFWNRLRGVISPQTPESDCIFLKDDITPHTPLSDSATMFDTLASTPLWVMPSAEYQVTPDPQVAQDALGAKPAKSPAVDNVITKFKMHLNPDEVLDLEAICQKTKNARYDPRRFPAVFVSVFNKGVASIFKNGIINAQASSVEDSHIVGRKILLVIRKIFPDQFPNSRKIRVSDEISVVHAQAASGFKISIESISVAWPSVSSYEPEAYAGLVFRMLQPKVTALIFVSGSIRLIGKSEEDIKTAMKNLEAMLPDFKCKGVPPKAKSCIVKKKKTKTKKGLGKNKKVC